MQTDWKDRLSRVSNLTEPDQVAQNLRKMMDERFLLDDEMDEIGDTVPPMVWAVIAGHGRNLVLAEMLRLGANPNIQSKDTGRTPLMYISGTNFDTMQILLKGGADTEIQDKKGQTALHMAAGNLKPQAVSLLLAHGANRLHRDHTNLSASDRARASGIAFADALPSTENWSPRHQAASDAALAAAVAEIMALLETKTAE